jgi:hypothetical protein
VESWIIGKLVAAVAERTRISHVSHKPHEKGCAKPVRCVKSLPKANVGKELENAYDPQWTWLPQLPQRGT